MDDLVIKLPETTNAARDSIPETDLHASKRAIALRQYEFEHLLLSQQLWSQQQAAAMELSIKEVASKAAAETSGISQMIKERSDILAEGELKELRSERVLHKLESDWKTQSWHPSASGLKPKLPLMHKDDHNDDKAHHTKYHTSEKCSRDYCRSDRGDACSESRVLHEFDSDWKTKSQHPSASGLKPKLPLMHKGDHNDDKAHHTKCRAGERCSRDYRCLDHRNAYCEYYGSSQRRNRSSGYSSHRLRHRSRSRSRSRHLSRSPIEKYNRDKYHSTKHEGVKPKSTHNRQEEHHKNGRDRTTSANSCDDNRAKKKSWTPWNNSSFQRNIDLVTKDADTRGIGRAENNDAPLRKTVVLGWGASHYMH